MRAISTQKCQADMNGPEAERRGECEMNGFYSNRIKTTDLDLDRWVQGCLCFHSNTQCLVWL